MKLHKQSGVAAVELALIMVPLLVMAFGIVEIGRALNYYNGVVKATRSAARYLTAKNLNSLTSGTTYDSGSTNTDVQKAIALAWCGTTTCASGALSLVPGLDASKITVRTNNDVPTGVGTVNLVTVTIGGTGNAAVTFQSFLPYTITNFTFSPIKITMAWSVT